MKPKLVVSAVLSFLSFAACADSLPRPNGATFDSGALFTVAGYAAGKPALANFPVLVRIAEDSPAGFSYDDLQSKATGADLAFVGMDGNGLPFEIDTWDTNGTSLVWVRLPSMTNGAQFAMCWGSETSGKTFCPDNPFADYVGVWHMDETGTASASNPVIIHDSTDNGLDGSTAVGSFVSSGPFGGARRIATDREHVHGIVVDATSGTKKDAADAMGTDFHASCWVHAKGSDSTYGFLVDRRKGENGSGWGVRLSTGNKMQVYYGAGSNARIETQANYSALYGTADGNWNKIDVLYKYQANNEQKQTADIYLNGTFKETVDLSTSPVPLENASIGIGGSTQDNPSSNNKGRHFDGEMDEVRFSAGIKSSDWIAADFATQSEPAFLTAGDAVPYGDNPRARVEVVSAAYTNATVSAVVSALGAGATSADVLVEIAASSGFENPAWTTNFAVSAAGTQSFAATGLATGTTYHVRATLENNAGADPFVTRTATFTTLVPGAPAGTAEPGRPGFTTLSAAGTATAFGEGATGATMRLEASTDAGFATLAGTSATVPATIGQAAALEIANLDPATEYRLRLRLVNDWGLETFVALPATATLAGPIDADDIRWTFSADVSQVDVFLDVTAVYAGATGTATLYCDEDETPATARGDRTVAEPGTLAWSALPFADHALHAKVVLVSEAGGLSYTQAWTAVVDHNFKRLRPQKLDIDLERVDVPAGIAGSVLNPGYAFDDDLSTGVPSYPVAASVVGSLTNAFVNPRDQEAYVSRLEVTHAGGCRYSLYTSADGETWTLVPDATNVLHAGTVSYPLSAVANFVKCTFESSSGWSNAGLLEIEAWGYVKAKAKVVSRRANASMHNSDGSAMTANGQGGWNSDWGRLFDGNLTNYQMWPKAPKGGYALVDFTRNDGSADALQEYFVTELKVSSTGTKKFTLQYSVDGEDWIDVDGAVNVSQEGVATFVVAKTVKKVRYVFVDGSWNDFEDWYLAEFQVWGIDPNDAPCDHSTLSDWDIGAVPATCTERAKDSRMCLLCGERFTKISDNPPLGHDYATTLDQPGRFSRRRDFPDRRRYGAGRITCSRCSFRLDFPTALDLVTNKVDGMTICGVKTANIVRFTDLSVSSENHPEYGPAGNRIIDGDWSLNKEYPHWYSAGTQNQYADFEFGTTIDLTAVEFAVYNHGYELVFCNVDDDTGTETAFCSIVISREEEEETATKAIEVVDPQTGRTQEVLARKEVTSQYQRIALPFFETPIKHLRIRIADDEPISVWGATSIRVLEIHPWGTVCGASDYPTEKTTILILR